MERIHLRDIGTIVRQDHETWGEAIERTEWLSEEDKAAAYESVATIVKLRDEGKLARD